MDLTVPRGMGGKEAIEHLYALDPEVCAVVSTGSAQGAAGGEGPGDGELAQELSRFRGVLAKPYMLKDLEDAIRRALS
jgi:hypothetical protein